MGGNQKDKQQNSDLPKPQFLHLSTRGKSTTHITGLLQPLQKITNNQYCELLPIFSILSKVNMYYIYYRNKCCFWSHCSIFQSLPTELRFLSFKAAFLTITLLSRRVRKSWTSNNWRALLKIHRLCSLHKPWSLLCPIASEFHVQFKAEKNKVKVPMPWATYHKQDQLPSFILYWESDKNI